MKKIKKPLSLLLALLLLAGCAVKTAPQEAQTPEKSPEPTPTEAPAREETPKEPPAREETPEEPPPWEETTEPAQENAPAGEPKGWEEEWPEEYVADDFRLEDGAIAQTGKLYQYRYTQLDGAERYKDIIALYLSGFLGDDLGMEEDSPHDGYANWFITGEGGGASVSGSSITGRFSYTLQPDFDRILAISRTQITDAAAMEQAARNFAALFSEIMGELELLGAEAQESYYYDERADELKDVTMPVMVYTFRSKENSELTMDIQDGLSVPVSCGDSEIADPNVHCFTATVWPDGTVVNADNYITRAGVTEDGVARMLEERDLPRLLNFFTSFQAHDTVVFESICADHFEVYFGSAYIEPTITVAYHFESDPDEHYSTQFVLPGLFDPV